MGQPIIQPSRVRRAFNGWCKGLFAGQHFKCVLNLGCGHDVDRQGLTYSGYFMAKKVIRVDPQTVTNYPPEEFILHGGDTFENPVDVIASAESLPFDDSFFDMVFCNWVIYHTDYNKALDEICRVLVPSGKLFASYMDAEQFGPVYKSITSRFETTAYAYLHMDQNLDGRDWAAEAVWGQKK